MKKTFAIAAVAALSIVPLSACGASSWQDEVRAESEAELAAMSDTEVAEMCGAFALFGVTTPEGLMAMGSAFGGEEWEDEFEAAVPEGVEPIEVVEAAWGPVADRCDF